MSVLVAAADATVRNGKTAPRSASMHTHASAGSGYRRPEATSSTGIEPSFHDEVSQPSIVGSCFWPAF